MLLQILILAVGVAILVVGAEFFVKGASSLAERFGISQFVNGLVVVGFGTSTPELAVNIGAAVNGNTDIAIGNVVERISPMSASSLDSPRSLLRWPCICAWFASSCRS